MLHLTLLSLLFLQPQTVYPAGKKLNTGWTKTQITYKDGGPRAKPARSHEEYVQFSHHTQKAIDAMTEVVANERERQDLRALNFMLKEFNEAANAGNYSRADDIRERMKPAVYRGHGVAGVAEKRKADWARAEQERRHREEMRQRERHHREWIRRSTIPQPVIIGNPRGRF